MDTPKLVKSTLKVVDGTPAHAETDLKKELTAEEAAKLVKAQFKSGNKEHDNKDAV